MAVRVHEREQRTNTTATRIELAVLEVLDASEELTVGEQVRVLSTAFHSLLGSLAKAMIREERHGTAEPNTPGGWE